MEKTQVLPWVDSVGGSYVCGVPRSLEFLIPLSFSLSLSLIIPGIEEGTGDQCETLRNCTWRPRLAHLFFLYFFYTLTFLAFPPSFCPSPSLFRALKKGHADSTEVADSRTGSAVVLALPIFSLFPVLLSSPFLPTLFHLRSSSIQLENHLFVVVFHSIFRSVFAEA